MRLLVVTERRFHRSAGRAVTAGAYGYTFWARYLDVFEEVGVLARVHETPCPNAQPVSGPGVRVVEIPAYVGPMELLCSLVSVRRLVREAADRWEAILVRAPSALGTLLLDGVVSAGRPYGLEVIGDPREVFAPGAVRHPLRAFFRVWFTRQLGRQCRRAASLSYVNRALRARYPPRSDPPEPVVVYCPGDDLPDSDLADRARPPGAFAPPFRLVTVTSLEQPYKGVDVLIRAIDACRRRGLSVSLTIVGGGREESRLQALARSLSLAGDITFVGQVPSHEVCRHLRAAHLFVLASRTEGLPQSLIEAMAVGLPCVATAVGGIPDLLRPEDLVVAGSVSSLADTLATVLTDPARLAAMSARNLEVARSLSSSAVRPRRRIFLEAIRSATVTAGRSLS